MGSLFGSLLGVDTAQENQNAENDAIDTYNKEVIAKNAGDMNKFALEANQARVQTANALFNIGKESLNEQSKVEVQNAATGTIGTSANQAVSNVKVQESLAKGTAELNYKTTSDEIESQIASTTESATSSLKDYEYGAAESASWSAMSSLVSFGATAALALL